MPIGNSRKLGVTGNIWEGIEEGNEMNISKNFGVSRLLNDKQREEKGWQVRATSHLIRCNSDHLKNRLTNGRFLCLGAYRGRNVV